MNAHNKKKEPIKDAKAEGVEAADSDVPFYKNPYKSHQQEYDDWNSGWLSTGREPN